MQIIICDDLVEHRNIIREHIHRYSIKMALDYVVHEFESAETLLNAIKKGNVHPDILFMDIYMTGMTGMDATKLLIAQGFQGAVIFTTTSKNHAIESYEMMADGYLVKPFTEESFQRNFERVVSEYAQSFKTVSFLCDRLEFRVFLKDLEFIEASNERGCLVHAKNETLRTTKPMAEFLKELSCEKQFLQCHRSCVINLQYVEKIEEDVVRMKNGKQAPLARANRQVIRKAVADYFFLKMREDK